MRISVISACGRAHVPGTVRGSVQSCLVIPDWGEEHYSPAHLTEPIRCYGTTLTTC